MALQSLLRLENDPRFKGLSYNEQQAMRQKVAYKELLQTEPRFNKLSRTEQQQFVGYVVGKRPPVYQNQEFAKTANELTNKIEGGDEKAMLIFLKNLQDRYGMKAGMLKAGSALISMKLADWVKEQGLRTALGEYATSDFLTGSDADKFYAHASKTLFSDNPEAQERFQKALRVLQVSSPVLSFGADLAAMWGGSIAVSTGKAAMGAVGKATGNITAKLSAGQISKGAARIGYWASRTGIPASLDALLGGTYGVARQNVISLANNDPDGMTDSIREFGRAFGEFAAWDLALGMAIPTLMGFAGGATKRIFQHGDDLVRKPLPEVERKALLKHFEVGDMNKAQLEMMTDVGQDLYVQNQALRKLGDNIEELRVRPLLAAQADAATNNMVIRQLDDGNVRLTKLKFRQTKKGPVTDYVQEVHGSLLAAKTEMAEELSRLRRTKWTPKDVDAFDNSLANDRIRKLMITANNVNESLDPMYQFGLTKADVERIKMARTKSFRSPVQRIGVTNAEADNLVISKGAVKVDVADPEEVAKRLKETPRRFVDPDKPAVLPVESPSAAVKGTVVSNTPVSDDIYEYATKWARAAKQKEPELRESVENLRALFLMENGFDSHIKRAPDGSLQAIETFLPNRVRLISEEAVPELLSGKLDSVHAARVIRAGNNVGSLQQTPNGGVIGNETDLRKYWSKFTNKRWKKNFTRELGTDQFEIWKSPTNTYRLTIPEAGVDREFYSLREAKRFARQDWSDAKVVFNEAERRGLSAAIRNGKYEITTPDGTTMIAENSDEIKKIFKEYSDAGAANEIFDELQPNFTNEFEDIILSYDQQVVPPATMRTDLKAPDHFQYNNLNNGDIRLNTRQQAKRLITQTDAWVEDVAGTIDSPEFYSGYHGMRRAAQAKQGQFHEMLEYIYNDVFTLSDDAGKLTKYWQPKYADRRRMMYYYNVQQVDPKGAEIYKRMAAELGDLTEPEIRMAGRIREFYDSMAKRFGINYDKFVTDYMPRIKKYVDNPNNYQRILNSPMAEDIISDVFGTSNNVPGEVKAFFMDDRTSEFLSFFVEDDAMLSMIKYIDKGLAVEHIKPAWNQLRNTLTKLGNADLTEHMSRYARKVLNTFHTPGEDAIRKIGNTWFAEMNKRMAKKTGVFKKLIPKEGGDMLNIMYTLNYLNNMGFRPWLAIRNSFQVFTTLAPRVSNEVVGEAITQTHRQINEGDHIIESLRQIGFLDRRPPIRGELGSIGTRLNRISEKAFKMFKGSDDYTRLVAYNAADVQLERAFDQIRKGNLNLNTKGGQEAFMQLSGLNKADRFLADELLQKTKKAFSGKVPDQDLLQSVKMARGKKLIDETMFVYDSAQSPMMFDGVVGKAFGRYGTYSVGYRANIWRGLKYGSPADKAAFIGRFITNQAALWATFGALGIKASNFIPGQPALFTGGPMFDLGLTLIRSADPSGYQGRQARGELSNALSQLVPGSVQYRYLKKAKEYSDKGDWWKALLSLTSTPTLRGPFLSN